MKKKSSAVWVGIAATWFGMHCGSGFATGTQYTIYYNRFGWMAMFLPILTWVILGFSFYFIFEYGRRLQIESYADYAKAVFIPKYGWFFVLLFDLWCVFGQILGEAGILAGSGSLFESYGINYWVGVVVAGVIVFAAVIFGAKVITKFSTVLMYGLIVIILILSVVGVSKNWSNFVRVMSTHATTEGTTLWDGIKSACTYAGVQVSAFMALSGLMAGLSSEKESRKAAIGGGVLNCVMLMALGMVMIANFPSINKEVLPVYTALNELHIPILTFLYSLMLFMALITTGAGCAFAIVTRFKGYPMKWFGWGERTSSAVVALILMAIGVFSSQFGLIAIFSQGYSYLAKMAWPLGILPALIIVPIRLHKMNNEGKVGAAE